MNPKQTVENILNMGDPNHLLTALIPQMGETIWHFHYDERKKEE